MNELPVVGSIPWEGVGRGICDWHCRKPLPATSQPAAPLPKEGVIALIIR